MAYDARRDRLVLFGGLDPSAAGGCDGSGSELCGGTWESPEGAAGAASAFVMRVPWGAATAASTKLVAATASLHAGGHAAYGLDETPGLRLMVYDRGSFIPAAVAEHHSSATGPLVWTTRDALQLQRLPVGEHKEISFAVVSPDVPRAGRAQAANDQREFEVRYRLPATVNPPTEPP